jgi:hypothetical protein
MEGEAAAGAAGTAAPNSAAGAGGTPPHAPPAAEAAADPRLDFFSHEFDALLALTTPGVEPPQPRARPLDNLSKCRALLPPDMEVRQQRGWRRRLRLVVVSEPD